MQAFSAVATLISLTVLCLGIWMSPGKQVAQGDDADEKGQSDVQYGYIEMTPSELCYDS